ncbi:MAG: hypothetical protein KJ718_04020 [Nanoarchaeota archaeon]|nr:hypothetical protein [Nanoarchaeota archaeon]MBU1051695.1 hypothetical protein [Nanoarchaeota archaeon]
MKKKAQEEMVGFVLIMLVVAVVFLVFLGIYLRQATNAEPTSSAEISQFLEAAFEITTECGTPFPRKLRDVILMCDTGIANCPLTGEDPCVILKETMENVIKSSWVFAENSPTKGYVLDITRETTTGPVSVLNEPIFGGEISCRQYRSAAKPLPDGITMKLEICL